MADDTRLLQRLAELIAAERKRSGKSPISSKDPITVAEVAAAQAAEQASGAQQQAAEAQVGSVEDQSKATELQMELLRLKIENERKAAADKARVAKAETETEAERLEAAAATVRAEEEIAHETELEAKVAAAKKKGTQDVLDGTTTTFLGDAARGAKNMAVGAVKKKVGQAKTAVKDAGKKAIDNTKKKAAESGVGAFQLAVDAADFVEGFGDIAVGVVNAFIFLQALRYPFTALLIAIISAIDFFMIILFPGPGYIIDIFFPSVCINSYLLARARAKKETKETGREVNIGFFEDEDGDPTYISVFWLFIVIALPLWELFQSTPNMFNVQLSIIVLGLFFLMPSFRKEFGTPYGAAFFVTLVLHLVNIGFLGGKAGALGGEYAIIYNIAMYITVAVLFLLISPNWRQDFKSAMIVSLMAILIYSAALSIAGMINNDVRTGTMFVIAFAPVWPIFTMMRMSQEHPYGYSAKLLKSYIFAVVVIGLVYLLTGIFGFLVGVFSGVAAPDTDTKGDISTGLDKIWDRFTGVYTDFTKVYTRAQNPETYYTGRVEENADVPLGVEIESLRPSDSRVSNLSNIIVYGNVRARPIESENFLGTSVNVVPACVIETEEDLPAAVDPPSMEIIWGTFGQFQCEFPPVRRRGTYTIKGTATFPFQTWAYIPYTFIDEERARNLAIQGIDLRQELDIPEIPLAIYTGGPVMLGMGGTPQPIIVKLDDDPILSAGSRIGITLDSNWRNGKISNVDALELKVPEPFYLYDCDRKHESSYPDPHDPAYKTYVFENIDVDEFSMFTSVTCKVGLDNVDAARQLVSVDKAVRSFVGVAHYDYTVEERTSVQVR